MSDIIDKPEMLHELNVLLDQGIANTELITREYQFTADNEIDAKTLYGCGSVGTKTITPLPSNTIAMHCQIYAIRNGNRIEIYFKRKIADVNIIQIEGGVGAVGWNYMGILIWLPTNGNQFHINALNGIINTFKIIGYKVKGA